MEAEAYIRALMREKDLRFGSEPWSEDGREPEWNTGYIGGGTPSVLPLDLLRQVIGIARIEPGGEYTIEANPEQVDSDWISEVVSAGINRVSMGVQSFIPALLGAVGRDFQPGRAMKAIETLCMSGFNF